MPTIYDIDFSKAGPRLMPPDKRFPVMKAWIAALLSPLQWIANLWLGEYRASSTAPVWIAGTYAKYARVLQNTIVYESLVDGNTANPSDTTKWQIVQKNFIGLTERLLYNGETLSLTYALNKRFLTTFRQPALVSDIFISNNDLGAFPFIIGADAAGSSVIYSNTSSDFIVDGFSFTNHFNFNINIPVAVYTALDPLLVNRDKIVRAFVDNILPSGITYTIITY